MTQDDHSKSSRDEQGMSPSKKDPRTSTDGIVEELRNVLSGLNKPEPAPTIDPSLSEMPSPPQIDSPFLHSRDPIEKLGEPEKPTIAQSYQPTDSDFWQGNVLGWPNAPGDTTVDNNNFEKISDNWRSSDENGTGAPAAETLSEPTPENASFSTLDLPPSDGKESQGFFGMEPESRPTIEEPDFSSQFAAPPMPAPTPSPDLQIPEPPEPPRYSSHPPIPDHLEAPPIGDSEPPSKPETEKKSEGPKDIEMLKEEDAMKDFHESSWSEQEAAVPPAPLSSIEELPSGRALQTSVPIPGTIENSSPNRVDVPPPAGTELPASPVPDRNVVRIACMFPEGEEKSSQQFAMRLKESATKGRSPFAIETVFVQPWKKSNLDLSSLEKSAGMSGAKMLFIIARKKDKALFERLVNGPPNHGLPARLVVLEQIDLRPLYADIVVDLRPEENGDR